MRALVIVLMVALAGCAPPFPTNEQVNPPPRADEAAELAMSEWSRILLGPGRTFDVPPIYWFEGPCLDYGGDTCHRGGYAEGALLGDGEIHLVRFDRPSDSSMVHELLHAALDQRGGCPDQDHVGDEWTFVDAVTSRLNDAGM